MSLFRSTAAVTLARFTLGGVAFGTDVLISRFLGASGKGEYYTLVVVASILSTVVTGGQDYALNEHGSGRDRQAASQLLGSAFVVVGIAWTSLWMVSRMDGVVEAAARLLESQYLQQFLGALLGWTGLEAMFVIAGMLVVTLGGPVKFATVRVFRRVLVLLGAILVVAVASGVGEAIQGLLWVQAGAAAVTGFTLLVLAGCRMSGPSRVKGMVRSGVASLPARLAERLQNRAAVLMVAAIGGSAQVGLFSVALGLAELLFYITGSLGSVLFSVPSGDEELYFRPVRLTTPILTFVALAIGAAGLAVVPTLYGDEFAPAVLPLAMLLPGVACIGVVQTLSPFMVQRGLARIISLGQIVGLVVLVVATGTFTARWGAAGAAGGVTLGYATTLLFCVAGTRRATGHRVRTMLLPSRRDFDKVQQQVRDMFR